MSGTNFKTVNNTFRQLFGNGLTYRIPRFQRDYSWTDVEWEDLWTDIQEVAATGIENAHYMGYLVLQSQDERNFDVIDGQQRLTTISIIVLATLRNLQRLVNEGERAEENTKRIEQIRSSYIGYLDPVTLVARSKLSLNRNNDYYYQTYLVPLYSPLPMRGFKASEKSMREASDWFERRIADYANDPVRGDEDRGVRLARLVELICDRLFFTVITVSDELNAYKVFETLNARGVRLSATDLLKNYLFSVLHKAGEHEQEMNALEDRWERLVSRLGETNLPDFLRVHWMSRNGIVRQPDLFKAIRSRVTKREEAFQLLANLDSDIDAYLGLTQPDNSDWLPEAQDSARLLRQFSVRQPYVVLVAASKILEATSFRDLLRMIVVISFRYNVIGSMQAGEQERVYTALAVKISHGGASSLAEIVDGLRAVYPNDEQFRAAFAAKELKTTQSRNNRIVRYIFAELERQTSGLAVDRDNVVFTIEHILPQNPQSGWDAFSEPEIEAGVYRLGNMTLLERSLNDDVGNGDFASKCSGYARSEYQLTKTIPVDFGHWDSEQIARRQDSLARVATSVWRVAQLS
jgi:Protein of unknown function DUF262/Protein of unknown function (DUF1524)